MDGRKLSEGGTYEHPDIRHEEKLPKKAQRYFKERRVKFQFIDLKEKGMSKGELESVARAVGGIDAVIDPKAKDADQKFEKVLDNQQILREPIVRNGRQATVGYEPDVWKGWE